MTDTRQMTPRQYAVHNLRRIITATADAPIEADDALRAIEDAITQLQLGGTEDAVTGNMVLAVTHRDGRVILDFGTKVAWLGMSPAQAKTVARALAANALAITGGHESGGTNGEEAAAAAPPGGEAETLGYGDVVPDSEQSGGARGVHVDAAAEDRQSDR